MVGFSRPKTVEMDTVQNPNSRTVGHDSVKNLLAGMVEKLDDDSSEVESMNSQSFTAGITPNASVGPANCIKLGVGSFKPF